MSFILTLRLETLKWQEDKLNKHFRIAEKMYNKTCYHIVHQLECLKKDKDYQKYINLYVNEKDHVLKKQYSDELKNIRIQYGLSKSEIEKYMNIQRKESYKGTLHSAVTQKIADSLWFGVQKILFSDGKKLHFKKYGTLNTLQGKSNKTGIVFNKELNIVEYSKMNIPVKIRKNDFYAQEAIEQNRIAYCKIIKKTFRSGYRYFVQIVFDGIPPIKHTIGSGNVGIDIGTSTISAVGDNDMIFKPLTPDINKHNKEIIRLQRKLERSRKQNNPDNYNDDGTIKKGNLIWNRTKNYMRILFQLKDAYRRRNVYVEQIHNKYANEILLLGSKFSIEDMNFKALQKRSKTSGIQNKVSTITTKNGKTKQIHKKKKKKRFGKSLNNHSPAKLVSIIERKLSYHNEKLTKVDRFKYKASQYNIETDQYTKSSLNERWKTIFNKNVQRDLYSAFLIKNKKTLTEIDRTKCISEFNDFMNIHDKLINKLKMQPGLPSCMGL